jgi:hypothetical protein
VADRTVIICDKCRREIVRQAGYLACECSTGFVAQWRKCLGGGRFLGWILNPLPTQEGSK